MLCNIIIENCYITLFAVCYLYRSKISTCFAPDSSITTWRTSDVLAQNCAMETLHLIESHVIEIHVFNANVCYIPTVYKQTAFFYRITTCVCNIDRMVDIGKQRHKKNSVPPALVCVAGANSLNSRLPEHHRVWKSVSISYHE